MKTIFNVIGELELPDVSPFYKLPDWYIEGYVYHMFLWQSQKWNYDVVEYKYELKDLQIKHIITIKKKDPK